MHTLQENLQSLAEVQSTNTEVFASGFEAVDRRIYTMMRLLEEAMIRPEAIYHKFPPERVGEEPALADGRAIGAIPWRFSAGIDWQRYFVEYEVMQGLIRFVQNHAAKCPVEEDLSVTVFGGDPNG